MRKNLFVVFFIITTCFICSACQSNNTSSKIEIQNNQTEIMQNNTDQNSILNHWVEKEKKGAVL